MVRRSKECLKCAASLTCLTNGVPQSVRHCRYCHETVSRYPIPMVSALSGNIERYRSFVSLGGVFCEHPDVVHYSNTCAACNGELREKTKRR